MGIYCYNPYGYAGGLVQIEVDLRRGLPSMDIVGLAGGAVREARERVRAAITNSGFEFPSGHITVSLSPAGVPKAGSAFDLAIALALLEAADGTVLTGNQAILVMGELTLGGQIRHVDAIIPALLEAKQTGISRFLIPKENESEAKIVLNHSCVCAATLVEARFCLNDQKFLDASTNQPGQEIAVGGRKHSHFIASHRGIEEFDLGIFTSEPLLFLGLMAAAAGHHHILVYGPPGVGKTMALRFLGRLLPDLTPAQLLEVNRLHSLAGRIDPERGLLTSPPIRNPHHGSSPEALLGGGKFGKPGEISLAHNGLLILDEVAEFRKNVLQSLREPMEDGMIRLGRVDGLIQFPAAFILGMSLNPCPCGKYGSGKGTCACSAVEVHQYWARIGAPIIDRTDIRIQLGRPATPSAGNQEYRNMPIFGLANDFDQMRARVNAVAQAHDWVNGDLRGFQVVERCRLEPDARDLFTDTVQQHGLLSRSGHAILRLARTLADLCGQDLIDRRVLDAALRLRSAITPVEGISLFQ